MTALITPREHAWAATDYLSQWGLGPDAPDRYDAEGAPIRAWANTLSDTLSSKRRTPLRNWLKSLHVLRGTEVRVETAQIRFGTRDFDDAVSGVWIPGPRAFNLYTSSVQFHMRRDPRIATDFSTRYFSGVRTIAATDTAWIGWNADMRAVIVYRVLEG